jgi:hypothetical protein
MLQHRGAADEALQRRRVVVNDRNRRRLACGPGLPPQRIAT